MILNKTSEKNPWSDLGKEYAICEDRYLTETRELVEPSFNKTQVTIQTQEDFIKLSNEIAAYNKSSYDIANSLNFNFYTVKKLIVL